MRNFEKMFIKIVSLFLFAEFNESLNNVTLQLEINYVNPEKIILYFNCDIQVKLNANAKKERKGKLCICIYYLYLKK